MKQGITGSAINQLDVLSAEYQDRIKATNKLNELKQRGCILDKKVTRWNGCILTTYTKK